MTTKSKKFPRCPYCGAEMTLEDNEDVLFGLFADEEKMYWYQCNAPSCGIHSPANHTKAGAYKAAMKRYEEPNRVLTLEEVKDAYFNTEKPICCELMWRVKKKIAWIADAAVPWGNVAHIVEKLEPKWKEYGKTWRCWLRKPTDEEREAIPWEVENDDDD